MINLRAFLIATFYDRAMRSVERCCLGEWRSELLAPLRGDVLEIGTGTGANLQYYPQQLKRLVLSEPDPYMRGQLQARVNKLPFKQVTVTQCRAEQVNHPDASFDHIVSTLVLCSVSDVNATLKELKRLLKPGGSLILLEHVRADDNAGLLRLQKGLEPIWRWCACNCHLTRPTGQLLAQIGFETRLEQVEMKGAPPFVRPMIKGAAVRSWQHFK